MFHFFSECWLVGPLQWPVGLFQLRFLPWLKPLVTPLDNVIFLSNFLLDSTKNPYNQRGFSNVTFTTGSLPRQMLTKKLSTTHFAMIDLGNRKLWIVRRSILRLMVMMSVSFHTKSFQKPTQSRATSLYAYRSAVHCRRMLVAVPGYTCT